MPGKEREPQTEFGRMLRDLRHQQRPRMGQEIMAKRLGVSTPMYGRYERGYIVPPPETVESMAIAFGADPAAWLATAGHEETPESAPATFAVDTNVMLLVCGEVHGGGGIVRTENDEARGFDCRTRHRGTADFLLEVIADAAFPIFVSGDFVAIRNATTASPGQVVLVEGAGEHATLIRYAGQRQGKPAFRRLNVLYPPLEEAVRIVGVVSWMHRGANGIRDFGR